MLLAPLWTLKGMFWVQYKLSCIDKNVWNNVDIMLTWFNPSEKNYNYSQLHYNELQ